MNLGLVSKDFDENSYTFGKISMKFQMKLLGKCIDLI